MKSRPPASQSAAAGPGIRPVRDAIFTAIAAGFVLAHVTLFAMLLLRGSLLVDEHERVEDLAARAAQSVAALPSQSAPSGRLDADLAGVLSDDPTVVGLRVYSLEGGQIRGTREAGGPLTASIVARIRQGLDEVEARLPDIFRTPRSLTGYAPVHGSGGAVDRIVAVDVDLTNIRTWVAWIVVGGLGATVAVLLAAVGLGLYVYRSRLQALRQEADLTAAQATERKAAESVAGFISQNPTPHLEFDGDEFLRANHAAARAFGADSPDALLAMPLWSLWPKRQPDGALSAEAWSEHVLRAMEESFAHFEWTFRRTDGSSLEMDVFLSRATDEQREVLLLACYDLSEIHSAQAQLIVSEQRFRDVSDAVGEFIWEVDVEGRYVFVSPRVQEVLGRAPKDVLGHHPFDWLPAEDRDQVVQESDEIVAEAGPFRNFVHRIRRSDGEILWISASGVPRFDDSGQCIGYRGASLDITERQRHEQELRFQKEAAEAAALTKSAFLAMMSHEIRTPLNSVLGFADLILQTPLDDLQREYLDTIQRSGDALLVLLNDILDFSKIESGRMAVEIVATDLHRCVEDVVDLYLPASRSRDVALEIRIDPGIPRHVRTDSARLRQILINLVGNAVKFTDRGSVTVDVRRANTSEAPVVRFEVVDTGIGISAEKIQNLFQPFSQADTSTTRRFGGTGLGLAISRRLAGLLDGEIGIVKSSEDGTTFYLEIPLVLPTEMEAASLSGDQRREPPPINETSRRALRVLVVDDNPINRRLTTQLLALLGDRSEAVGSAKECYAALEAGSFDVILMDVQMPEIDGLDATRAIRERELGGVGRRSPLPIVALTAGAMSDDREACFAAGMDFYLTKPIRRDALERTLRKISERA